MNVVRFLLQQNFQAFCHNRSTACFPTILYDCLKKHFCIFFVLSADSWASSHVFMPKLSAASSYTDTFHQLHIQLLCFAFRCLSGRQQLFRNVIVLLFFPLLCSNCHVISFLSVLESTKPKQRPTEKAKERKPSKPVRKIHKSASVPHPETKLGWITFHFSPSLSLSRFLFVSRAYSSWVYAFNRRCGSSSNIVRVGDNSSQSPGVFHKQGESPHLFWFISYCAARTLNLSRRITVNTSGRRVPQGLNCVLLNRPLFVSGTI